MQRILIAALILCLAAAFGPGLQSRVHAQFPGQGMPQGGERSSSPAEAAPQATAGGATSPATLVFFLVVILCLFGYHLFSTYTLNSRIDRLEEALRKDLPGRTAGGDDLLAFSWDGILDDMDRRQSLLPGDILKVVPGAALLALPDYPRFLAFAANALKHCIRDDGAAALFLAATLDEREIGRALLNLETGKDWLALDTAEREKLADSLEEAIGAYEEHLFVQTCAASTPQQLYDFCLRILEREDLRLILVEEAALLEAGGQGDAGKLDVLRLIGRRCAVPLVICTIPGHGGTLWESREALRDRLSLLAEVTAVDGGLALHVEKSPHEERDSALVMAGPSGALSAGT